MQICRRDTICTVANRSMTDVAVDPLQSLCFARFFLMRGIRI
jgi:hypothetical protein